MNNPFKNKSWYPHVVNKYVLIGVLFIIWLLFLDNYSYLDHRILNKELEALDDNKSYYKNEIKKDNNQIKKLKNPAQIEKYAREKYYMKRENEDIYIVEFEGDTIKE